MPNPGSTRNACAILVRKAKPSSSPAKTSHRVRSRSIARCTAYPAAVISSTRSASGLLNRKMRAAAGVSASTAPAMSPAAGPNQRRTAAYSSSTDATPSTACGASSDHELNPNIFADSSSTHSEAGVLSTVMKLDESNEPKKNGLPRLRPRLHRGGVEVVGVAVPAEVPQVQQRGEGEQAEQGGPGPLRIGRRAADQAAQPPGGRRQTGGRVRT